MEIQKILDLFLQSGQELVEKGKDLAEQKLNLPDDPAARQAALNNAGKGAIVASALAVLLGTQVGRKLTGTSLKLGSLAALGSIAYKAYQTWQQQSGNTAAQTALPTLNPEEHNKLLLKAMISAAKADGHIDEQEQQAIAQHIEKLGMGEDASAFLLQELNNNSDVNAIAAAVKSPEQASEVYLISRLILNVDNDQERTYLSNLAQAMSIAPELLAELDKQVSA